MNALYITLLEAGAQAAAAPKGAGWQMWAMLIAIFAIMYLFMIRPQRKQQKEMENFRNSLEKGSKVVTVGGIYGRVVEVQEKTLIVEIDNGVKIKIDKNSVVRDFSDAQPQQ